MKKADSTESAFLISTGGVPIAIGTNSHTEYYSKMKKAVSTESALLISTG